VVDAVWSLASPESLRKLTEERHWSIEKYEQWLAHMWSAPPSPLHTVTVSE
jgi:hypothetical protein